MSELTGKRFGHYLLQELIGRGGMAEVYRARQLTMNRDVAVKVLLAEIVRSETVKARFRQEAELIANLQHLHILPVIDFGEAEGGKYLYLVMQLMRGGTLAKKMRKSPFSLRQAADMLNQIASALTYAHRQGIVHRDLKPANVLLDEQGSAYLTDFGIAKIVREAGPSLTHTGTLLGTPMYMAPEQWDDGPIDARTDIYALGVMVYEMVVGVPPFAAKTPQSLMRAHIEKWPPPPNRYHPKLPAELGDVIFKALEKDPEARYPEAVAFARAFEQLVEKAEEPHFCPPRPKHLLEAETLVAPTRSSIRRTAISGVGGKTQISEKSRTVPKRPQGAESLQMPSVSPPKGFAPFGLGRKELRWVGAGAVGALLLVVGLLGWWLSAGGGDQATTVPAPPSAFSTAASVNPTATLPPTTDAAQVIVILPSDTPTPTSTLSATATPSPTPSATPKVATATPSPSATPSSTSTPSATPQSTATRLPSATPSHTAQPPTHTPTPRPTTPSPSATPQSPEADAAGLVESPCLARVNADVAVNVRAAPAESFAVVGRLLPGELAPVLLRSANGYVYVYSGWVSEGALQLTPPTLCQDVPVLAPGEELAGALCTLRVVAEEGSLRIAPQADAVRAYLEAQETTLAAFRVVQGADGALWYYVGTHGPSLHLGWIAAAEVEPITACPPPLPWDALPPVPTTTPVPTATTAPPRPPCYVQPAQEEEVLLRYGPGGGFAVAETLAPNQRARAYFRTTSGYVYVEGGWAEQRALRYTSARCAQLPVISPQSLSDAALCRVVITAESGELRTAPDPAAERMYVERSGLALSVLRAERGADGAQWYYVATNDGRFRFGWIAQAQVEAITSCP